MCSATFALLLSLTATGAVAETMKFADSEQGAAFDKCIKIKDFTTKTLDDEVEVVARDEGGCCPEGYTPGAKHYNNYQGAQVVCGFKEDGKVALSTGSSGGKKTCTYNGCYVMKQGLSCKSPKGDTKQLLNGCCAAEVYCGTNGCSFEENCKNYAYTFNTVYSEKVNYCLSYAKTYAMDVGTADKTDDVKEGKLVVENVHTYTACAGGAAGGGSAGAPAPSWPSTTSNAVRSAACLAGILSIVGIVMA